MDFENVVLKKSKKTIFLAKIRDFYKIWTDKVEKNEVLLLWELIHAIFEYFRTVKPNFKISIFETPAGRLAAGLRPTFRKTTE